MNDDRIRPCRMLDFILLRKSRLLYFLSATKIKVHVLQSHSKLVKILSECQTHWILVRRRVTRCLIRIQGDCIWDYGRDRPVKLSSVHVYLAKATVERILQHNLFYDNYIQGNLYMGKLRVDSKRFRRKMVV